MFYGCSKIKSIDLSKFDFSNVTTMFSYFRECINLEKIIFPKNILSIEDTSYMFQNCKKLTSIDLSNFKFSNIYNMTYLFNGCINLTRIIWPEENSSLKLNYGLFSYMFKNCYSLTSIDLSNFYFNGVIDLSNMFLNCTNLKYVKLNGNLDWNKKQITILYKTTGINVIIKTTVDNIFQNCSIEELNLLNININYNNELTQNINNIEGCLFNEYKSDMKQCQKYMGFYYCGECNNINTNEYCSKNIQGKNYNFYYFNGQSELSYEKRQCFWSNNNSNFKEYEFFNNIEDNINYYKYLYDNICEIFSKDKLGCTKCKSNFYPIDIDYNNYINKINDSFLCYEKSMMNNYYLDLVNSQFKKCAEKCKECEYGVDLCSICNDGYYKIEDQEFNCSKLPPAENYALDLLANQWRKCDERCRRCYKQTRSKIDHQCLLCNDNYYPYKTDYDNYKNPNLNLTGFNCYTLSEVKNDNINYYLSSESLFEKCDISCLECESENNFCTSCNLHYYYILGFKNGTCFKEPLKGYGLINIQGEFFFKKCFHLCTFCNQITQSFFYQQCKECDEEKYTLDLFSYQESFCIPKDKSNSTFITEQTKWYIENFEGIEQLNIGNENINIDLEKLLNDIKYNNISYKIVDKCPEDKPYIIYSIRQCVSSCNSKNLIEHGIFMTKKLYFYNNICYNKCPYGSIEDENNMKCIEINQYTKINNSISIYSYLENNNENILDYLSKYANNSVSITRNYDFSNYFYNTTTNDSFKMSLNMPIFNFSECINLLKNSSALDNETDIFIGIIEYNTQINKEGKYDINSSPVNSTTYQFFINNGTILNYSICFDKNITVTVQKMVDMNKLNIFKDIIKEINDNYNLSSLYNNGTEFNDRCIPLSLNKKDLTIYDRQNLVRKIIKPCDDNCEYIDFNYTSNYSTCKCPIKNQIKEVLKETDFGKYLDLLLENSNWKYIECSNNFFKINYSLIFFGFFVAFFIVFLTFIVIFSINIVEILKIKRSKNDNKKKNPPNEKATEDNKQDTNSIITNCESDLKTDEENNNTTEPINSIKNILKENFKENFLNGIFKEQDTLKKILFITLFLYIYFFFNVILFTDQYISVRYNKKNITISYNELIRILCAFFFSFGLLYIIKWIFDIKIDDNNKLLKVFVIFITILIILIQIFFFYFIHIFININPNSVNDLIISTLLSLFIYFIINFIIFIFFPSLLKYINIRIVSNND